MMQRTLGSGACLEKTHKATGYPAKQAHSSVHCPPGMLLSGWKLETAVFTVASHAQLQLSDTQLCINTLLLLPRALAHT